MKLALAQLEIEPSQVADNVARAVSAIETAAADGADLVALPEVFDVGYFAFDRYAYAAEGLDGQRLATVADTAAANDVGVLAGSIIEDLEASAAAGFETPADDGYANTSVFFDRNGERRGVYRKHHLFGYESAERDLLTPGESLATVDFDGFTVGMTTCYDLRFPGLFRDLVDEGVTLLLVPSAWPYPKVEHWQLFTRTRAVENLAYLGAINGVGEFEDAELLGRSAIYDPWGTVLTSADDEPAILTSDIDPERVADLREEFPALADRRR